MPQPNQISVIDIVPAASAILRAVEVGGGYVTITQQEYSGSSTVRSLIVPASDIPALVVRLQNAVQPAHLQWSEVCDNPFAAIRLVATPEDYEIVRDCVLKMLDWQGYDKVNLLDCLLEDIAGATSIVVRGDDEKGWRACYEMGDDDAD